MTYGIYDKKDKELLQGGFESKEEAKQFAYLEVGVRFFVKKEKNR